MMKIFYLRIVMVVSVYLLTAPRPVHSPIAGPSLLGHSVRLGPYNSRSGSLRRSLPRKDHE